MEQKIYSYAKELGFDKSVEYDSDYEMFSPTRKYEDTSESLDFIDEFQNDTFWEELVHNLIDRDLIKQESSVKNMERMPRNKRIEQMLKLEDYYRTEFENNGLDNLKIV